MTVIAPQVGGTMKITPNTIHHNNSDRISSTRSPSGVAAYGQQNNLASGSESATHVDLSTTAKQLQQLQSSEHDIDIERVQAVKDAIAAGKLKIDTSRIADSLIASARELLK